MNAKILALSLLSSSALAAAALPSGPKSEPPVPLAPRSSDWLNLLPDGEQKRVFVLNCTGCHVFDETRSLVNGRARTQAEWKASIEKMLGFAGPTTSFPVISAEVQPELLSAWLAHEIAGRTPTAVEPQHARAEVREYMIPEAGDLPHDVAVDNRGHVIITGMFTSRMYDLDPHTGEYAYVDIPLDRANPRALEIDAAGNWWVVLGGPAKVARYAPAQQEWRMFDVGVYAHSIGLDANGRAWVNGHFTRAPEMLIDVDPVSGKVTNHPLTKHPTMGDVAGGPIPYELRVATNGTVWVSELQGNRLVSYEPASGKLDAVTLPEPNSGPRRFDIDNQGIIWIPAYSANRLLRYDPAKRTFRSFELPIRDAVPYVARVANNGDIWIGCTAANAVFRFDPRTEKFVTYDLPSRGALVRHMTFDKAGNVWLAYGASPGIPARIARLTPG